MVVKQSDAARLNALDQSLRHPARIALEPIFSGDVPGDDVLAKPPGIEARRHRLMTVRWPKEGQTIGRKSSAAGSNLLPSLRAGQCREGGVAPGVVADRRPLP